MTSSKTALILGATGGIGGEVARQLHGQGWQVRALHRSAARASTDTDGLSWVHGDAMNPQNVIAAALGASVIVHAVNPPGYRRWSELVLPMLESSLAAAKAVGARIVLPGTVYNYGPDAFPLLREDSPQRPVTKKGAIRVEMERRLRAAADAGVRTLIVRAGDFFGPKAGNNWFAQGLVKPGRPVTTITYPGERGVGHQWAYLPDVARTMVQLLERGDTLETSATFHMQGHWDADGTQMIDAIRRVVAQSTGQPVPKAGAFPWTVAKLAAPFVPLFRELNEMRYLWQQPVRMENTRLVSVLGHEPHTPLDEAVQYTLIGLGCLPSHRATENERTIIVA